jgi:hypothetical protein
MKVPIDSQSGAFQTFTSPYCCLCHTCALVCFAMSQDVERQAILAKSTFRKLHTARSRRLLPARHALILHFLLAKQSRKYYLPKAKTDTPCRMSRGKPPLPRQPSGSRHTPWPRGSLRAWTSEQTTMGTWSSRRGTRTTSEKRRTLGR